MSNHDIPKISQDEAIHGNQLVHTSVAHRYNQSPHFRPENKTKVKAILKELRGRLSAPNEQKRLLDMGCGTGFILDLAHDFFTEVNGVDVTEAMIKQVDLSPGNIKVHISKAESTPFMDSHFDMVTAYSFIDHLADIEPFLAEVFRVLKKGGIFYADLNPNRAYWDYLFNLDAGPKIEVSPTVQREITNVVHNDELLVEETGLPPSVVAACESTKNFRRGFCPKEIEALARSLGFGKCEFALDWFMGQGPLMHNVSFEAAETVDAYLRQISPASDFLFKYLRMIFTK